MEYIKTILIGIALIWIALRIKKNEKHPQSVKLFFYASFIITTILFLVVVIKLHHLLRSEFNIPNTVTYLFVALLFTSYLIRFIKMMIMLNFYLFVISLAGFLLAVVYVF